MGLEFELAELTEKEKLRLDFKKKLNNGEIKPIDLPLEFYLEDHQDNYRLIRNCANFIIDALNIKTVRQFIDNFIEGIDSRLIEGFPQLAEPQISDRFEVEITDLVIDTCSAI